MGTLDLPPQRAIIGLFLFIGLVNCILNIVIHCCHQQFIDVKNLQHRSVRFLIRLKTNKKYINGGIYKLGINRF